MKSAQILVVEDEISIQTIVRTYLESSGYSVTVVDNGPEALAQAQVLQPDLVILDLNLPGMDGMEVAARLRDASGVYILMLSARGEEADRVAGLRLGADDYLTKPVSPRELAARVEAALRRSFPPPPSTPSNSSLAIRTATEPLPMGSSWSSQLPNSRCCWSWLKTPVAFSPATSFFLWCGAATITAMTGWLTCTLARCGASCKTLPAGCSLKRCGGLGISL